MTTNNNNKSPIQEQRELTGELIKRYRIQNKLTQQELAHKIGKTESSIRKYEKGLVEVPYSVLTLIGKYLNVDPIQLIIKYDENKVFRFNTEPVSDEPSDDVVDIDNPTSDDLSTLYTTHDLYELLNEVIKLNRPLSNRLYETSPIDIADFLKELSEYMEFKLEKLCKE